MKIEWNREGYTFDTGANPGQLVLSAQGFSAELYLLRQRDDREKAKLVPFTAEGVWTVDLASFVPGYSYFLCTPEDDEDDLEIPSDDKEVVLEVSSPDTDEEDDDEDEEDDGDDNSDPEDDYEAAPWSSLEVWREGNLLCFQWEDSNEMTSSEFKIVLPA